MKKSLFLLLIAAVVIGVGIYAFYGRIDHNNMNDVKEESTPVLVSNEVKNSIFKKEYSKEVKLIKNSYDENIIDFTGESSRKVNFSINEFNISKQCDPI